MGKKLMRVKGLSPNEERQLFEEIEADEADRVVKSDAEIISTTPQGSTIYRIGGPLPKDAY